MTVYDGSNIPPKSQIRGTKGSKEFEKTKKKNGKNEEEYFKTASYHHQSSFFLYLFFQATLKILLWETKANKWCAAVVKSH